MHKLHNCTYTFFHNSKCHKNSTKKMWKTINKKKFPVCFNGQRALFMMLTLLQSIPLAAATNSPNLNMKTEKANCKSLVAFHCVFWQWFLNIFSTRNFHQQWTKANNMNNMILAGKSTIKKYIFWIFFLSGECFKYYFTRKT